MERDKLIFEEFLRWVKKTPGKLAILDGKKSLTYQELYEKSCQLASTLNETDITSRYIFILGNKASESIIAILGALFSGFTYVALDINQPASRLDHIFSVLSPAILIFTGISPRLKREIKQMGESPNYILDLAGDLTTDVFKNTQRVKLKNKPILPSSYPDEQIAYTLFTSGSTGQPKGVCISHRAARAALRMFQKHIGLKPQDIIANQAALCFDLSVFDIFATLNAGATLCLIPPETTALPDRFFQTIAGHKAISLFTTPSTLDFLLTNTTASQTNPYLKKILLSGEPVSLDLLKKIYNTFHNDIEIWNLYGATEIPYALAQPIKKNSNDHINNFSLRGDEVEIKIRAASFENQNDTPIIGELLVKGPAVLSGYIHKNNQDMSSPLIEGGWYPTGDLASMDSKNQITLHGRADRQIKIKGHRVELDEIEFQLATCPEIQEAAVVFFKETQEIHAYLVLTPHNRSEQETLEIIENFCESGLPSMFCPSKFNIIENMPYTVSGKKDRKSLIKTELVNA
ncbi:MAG: AMP-binding protein [Alphaproteobacteria bacterium]|nr:AMP-binding protein [Alphaproteobacteria bacterium]MBP9777349.1 AMP-binding protein [Alphaproteobacteria bacterium]